MFKKTPLIIAAVLAVLTLTIPAFAKDFGLTATAQQAQYGETDIIAFVGNIITVVLSFIGIIFLAIMFYAGLRWLTARGNEEFATKAKDAMFNATVGLIIVTASYGIARLIISLIIQ